MLAFVSDTGIIVVVFAFVMLFGASQLPKMARNVAEAGKEFRKAHADNEAVVVAAPVVVAPTPLPAADDRATISVSDLDALLADRAARVPARGTYTPQCPSRPPDRF